MAATLVTRSTPYVDSTPLLNDPAALRKRAQADGYLYFKRLLDPKKVMAARRKVLEVAQKHGWLDDTAPLIEGIAKPGVCFVESLQPEWDAYYTDILRLREFHALALEPAIIGMYEKLFGEPVVLHSRNISRLIFPGNQLFTTPAHQDHLHIKGTTETWTMWIPAGDCPNELGGLAVLPGSHKLGNLPSKAAYGAGGQGVEVPEDSVWAEGDLECGDVLTFHSLTVHQGRDNKTPNKLRLSFDFRYQPLSHPIGRSSMEPHRGMLKWEQVYENWPANDPVKYYWKNWKLNYAD